jgi:hypothetical protein
MITDLQAASLNPYGEVAVAGGQQIHVHLTVDNARRTWTG